MEKLPLLPIFPSIVICLMSVLVFEIWYFDREHERMRSEREALLIAKKFDAAPVCSQFTVTRQMTERKFGGVDIVEHGMIRGKSSDGKVTLHSIKNGKQMCRRDLDPISMSREWAELGVRADDVFVTHLEPYACNISFIFLPAPGSDNPCK